MKGRLYFDGSARPNPGRMRIGVVLQTENGETEISKDVGDGTTNVAEYRALIEGLKKALDMGVDEIEIFGDSTLVVEQVLGNFRVRDPKLKELHSEVVKLLEKFKRWSIEWIPDSENSRAHELSQ